jgi:hypothetical protein
MNVDGTNWISRAMSIATVPLENRSRVAQMSVGAGTGSACAYCQKRIEPESVEYEVDAYVAAGLRTLHFHRVCLHLWEAVLAGECE